MKKIYLPTTFSYRKLNKLLFFVLLFFINIGFTEFHKLLDIYSLAVVGIVFLSFISLFILAITSYFTKGSFQLLFFIAFLLYLYLITSSIFGNLEYGLFKSYFGLLLPFTIAAIFGTYSWTEEEVLKYLTFATFIIGVIAILYKLKYGFYDRSVNYGLFGPITFGWIGGIGFFSVIFSKKRFISRIYLIIFFALLLMWSGSKGPFLGTIVILLVSFRKQLAKRVTIKLIIFVTVFLPIFVYFIYLLDIRQISFISKLFENPKAYLSGEGSGSIGIRIELIKTAYNLFLNSPIFGNGFGSFIDIATLNFKYPHNIYIELLAETGLVGLGIFLFLIYILRKQNAVMTIGSFGLIVLLFSGDFSYFRYALYLLLMGFFVIKNPD